MIYALKSCYDDALAKLNTNLRYLVVSADSFTFRHKDPHWDFREEDTIHESKRCGRWSACGIAEFLHTTSLSDCPEIWQE